MSCEELGEQWQAALREYGRLVQRRRQGIMSVFSSTQMEEDERRARECEAAWLRCQELQKNYRKANEQHMLQRNA
jgi:hypothetical protein